MNKIAVIESSLRCFVCGLLALLPIIGAGFTVTAFMHFKKCSTLSRECWNPARRYAVLGLAFATVGPVFSFGAWLLLIYCFKDEVKHFW